MHVHYTVQVCGDGRDGERVPPSGSFEVTGATELTVAQLRSWWPFEGAFHFRARVYDVGGGPYTWADLVEDDAPVPLVEGAAIVRALPLFDVTHPPDGDGDGAGQYTLSPEQWQDAMAARARVVAPTPLSLTAYPLVFDPAGTTTTAALGGDDGADDASAASVAAEWASSAASSVVSTFAAFAAAVSGGGGATEAPPARSSAPSPAGAGVEGGTTVGGPAQPSPAPPTTATAPAVLRPFAGEDVVGAGIRAKGGGGDGWDEEGGAGGVAAAGAGVGSMFRGVWSAASKGLSAAATAAAAAADNVEKGGGWLGKLTKRVTSALATGDGVGSGPGAPASALAREALRVLWEQYHDEFSFSREEHASLLMRLWSVNFPGVGFKKVAPQWRQLGFQTDDPLGDFREGGLLGLHALLFMSERHGPLWQRLLVDNDRTRPSVAPVTTPFAEDMGPAAPSPPATYPVALCVLTLVCKVARDIAHLDVASMEEVGSPPTMYWAVFETGAGHTFSELVSLCANVFHQTWLETGPKLSDMHKVMDAVVHRVKGYLDATAAVLLESGGHLTVKAVYHHAKGEGAVLS